MGLSAGTHLGPYEILAPLGAGGMGEVYRARDPRLGREVAIKVLPDEVARDARALSRFEHEARAVAALSHPNILALFDVGESGGIHYAVTELLQGQTLRLALADGPFPVRRALDIAVQIAEALAAAHENGIVHRDLKPENVFLGLDGRVKLLDFGLARHDVSRLGPSDTVSPTITALSQPGAVVGTVAYMSPEQAKGNPVDFRSDQFSLGIVLYEMLAGQRPFIRDSAAETLTSIIREEPEPLERTAPNIPAPVRWLVERCLSKEPGDRYASTRDLARDLATIRLHLSEAAGITTPASQPALAQSRRRAIALGGLALAAAVLAAGVFIGRGSRRMPAPTSWERLTFQRGYISNARFLPDGESFIYSAAWNGDPGRLFQGRLGSPLSTALNQPDAVVYALSRRGELAVGLRCQIQRMGVESGTLARVSLTGGAPHEVLDDVAFADFGPDGEEMAVVVRGQGRQRLEYPIGKSLLEMTGEEWMSDIRVSPDGERVAFLEHPAGDEGSVMVVDRKGNSRSLSKGWISASGLAWSPRGDEVWFTATRQGTACQAHAVSLDGRERLLATAPDRLTLRDVSRDGHLLISSEESRQGVVASPPGGQERDLSWLDFSGLRDVTLDGSRVLLLESGQGSGSTYTTYVRPMDGSPAVRLGEGIPHVFTRDGQWALVSTEKPTDTSSQLSLYPLRAGAPRKLTIDSQVELIGTPRFLPDGKHFVAPAKKKGETGARFFVLDVDGGPPRPISKEGIPQRQIHISSDGSQVLAYDSDGRLSTYPVDGGDARPAGEIEPGAFVAGWSKDMRSVWTWKRGGARCRVLRVDLATGTRSLFKEITLSDPFGARWISPVIVAPDGSWYAYGYWRILSTLFAASGAR